jgi:hypothetical protein
MSAFGVLDLLAQSRGAPHPDADAARGGWREQEGLLAAVAVALLAEGKEGPAARRILARLIGRGLLAEILFDLARTDPGAAGMAAHFAARLNPGAARAISAPTGAPRPLKSDEEAALVEWLRLAAAAAGRLLQSSDDSHMRARLALAWGRLARIAEEGEAWLEDRDPRVRANTVESLWGRCDEQAVSIFTRKLEDPHQRVAANAAVGLYLAGRAESIAALWTMAQAQDPARRTAAVWAIGRTGDARFLPLLAEMRRLKAVPVSLLRNVVQARERIRQAEELPRENVELRLTDLATQGPLAFSVQLPDERSAGAPPLRPVDFALEVNGKTVWQYQAWRSALASPDSLCLAAAGSTPGEAAQTALELATAAGESVRALLRLNLGYGGGTEAAKTGDILGLGGPSSREEGFATDAAGWLAIVRRAVQHLAPQSARPVFLLTVERGAPEWLLQAIPATARECTSRGVRFAVLHEPAAVEPSLGDAVRAAGGEMLAAPRDGFPRAVRTMLESQEETWRMEAPSVRAEDLRQLTLHLRSGWFRGQAEAGRAS